MARIALRPVHAPAHLANRETEPVHIGRNPL